MSTTDPIGAESLPTQLDSSDLIQQVLVHKPASGGLLGSESPNPPILDDSISATIIPNLSAGIILSPSGQQILEHDDSDLDGMVVLGLQKNRSPSVATGSALQPQQFQQQQQQQLINNNNNNNNSTSTNNNNSHFETPTNNNSAYNITPDDEHFEGHEHNLATTTSHFFSCNMLSPGALQVNLSQYASDSSSDGNSNDNSDDENNNNNKDDDTQSIDDFHECQDVIDERSSLGAIPEDGILKNPPQPQRQNSHCSGSISSHKVPLESVAEAEVDYDDNHSNMQQHYDTYYGNNTHNNNNNNNNNNNSPCDDDMSSNGHNNNNNNNNNTHLQYSFVTSQSSTSKSGEHGALHLKKSLTVGIPQSESFDRPITIHGLGINNESNNNNNNGGGGDVNNLISTTNNKNDTLPISRIARQPQLGARIAGGGGGGGGNGTADLGANSQPDNNNNNNNTTTATPSQTTTLNDTLASRSANSTPLGAVRSAQRNGLGVTTGISGGGTTTTTTTGGGKDQVEIRAVQLPTDGNYTIDRFGHIISTPDPPCTPRGTISSSRTGGWWGESVSTRQHAPSVGGPGAAAHHGNNNNNYNANHHNDNFPPSTSFSHASPTPSGSMFTKSPHLESAAQALSKYVEREMKWLTMLEDWEHVKPAVLKRRIRKGIPSSMRARVWPLIMGLDKAKAAYGAQYYQKLLLQEPPQSEDIQIRKDLPRVMQTNIMFQSPEAGSRTVIGTGQAMLYNVLRAYAVHDPQVGYVQGMDWTVALSLLYLPEEDSFWYLQQLLQGEKYNLRGLYLESFPLSKRFIYIHERLVKKFLPRLYAQMEEQQIPSDGYTFRWYTMRYGQFAPELAYRVLDIFLYEGDKILYRVALALLQIYQEKLLADPDSMLVTLMQVENDTTLHSKDDGCYIINQALKIPITTEHIVSFGKEYDAMKKKQDEQKAKK